jgi:hypothetical protein
VPPQQLDAIRRAKFHWFSHGHPDHLNAESLPQLTQGQILLSDHFGGRIANDLRAEGHDVRVLRDREWTSLSKNVRVYSIPNYNQDSVLLVDINGRLIINFNDSPDLGQSFHIRRIARSFKEVFHLQLHGWSGADMVNLHAPDGRSLRGIEEKRRPIAPRAQRSAVSTGANKVVPFSSFHRYQRSDSLWANALIPELRDYYDSAAPDGPEMLPAFLRVDCENDAISEIRPDQATPVVQAPEAFGDSWSDPLGREDKAAIKAYFQGFAHLRQRFGFIEVICGGQSVTVDLNPAKHDVGISFEAPRNSFIWCVENNVFDDMLIGNYMRATLHGVDALYPDFSPYVAKYGDNGGAKSPSQLQSYFSHYRARDPIGAMMHQLSVKSEQTFRALVPADSRAFRAAKKMFYHFAARG